MWTGIASIAGFLGNVVSGFFGFKQAQAQTAQDLIRTLGDVNASDASKERAIATIIAAESTNGYWLAAVWRPLTMVVFVGIVIAYAFGWTTPNLMAPMPSDTFMAQLFDLVKIGLCGYIPARTIEKIVSQINVGKIVQTLIDKKLS